jgi:hypothetical protein
VVKARLGKGGIKISRQPRIDPVRAAPFDTLPGCGSAWGGHARIAVKYQLGFEFQLKNIERCLQIGDCRA